MAFYQSSLSCCVCYTCRSVMTMREGSQQYDSNRLIMLYYVTIKVQDAFDDFSFKYVLIKPHQWTDQPNN